MSAAPKDAKVAAPAAAKAPAKAGAKGAAKSATKKKVPAANAKRRMYVYNPDGARKKSKEPLVPVIHTPGYLKAKEDAAALLKSQAEKRKTNLKAAKAIKLKSWSVRKELGKKLKEAKAKGLPKPDVGRPNRPKGKKAALAAKKAAKKAKAPPAPKDRKLAKKEALARKDKLAAEARKTFRLAELRKHGIVPGPQVKIHYVQKLTPLNQKFQDRFGILYSQYIGKAREKALRALHINVAVHRHGHPLNGRVGQLIYYTGKHTGFVEFKGRKVYKLPFGILLSRRTYLEVVAKNTQKKRNAARLTDYIRKKMAFRRRVAQAKKDGRPEPKVPEYISKAFEATPTVLSTLSKKSLDSIKRAEERKKKQEAQAEADRKAGIKVYTLPFMNVGRPVRSRSGFHGKRASDARAKVVAEKLKKRAVAAKVVQTPKALAALKAQQKVAQRNRRRRGQKGTVNKAKKAKNTAARAAAHKAKAGTAAAPKPKLTDAQKKAAKLAKYKPDPKAGNKRARSAAKKAAKAAQAKTAKPAAAKPAAAAKKA